MILHLKSFQKVIHPAIHRGIRVEVVTPGRPWRRMRTVKSVKNVIIFDCPPMPMDRCQWQAAATPSTLATAAVTWPKFGPNLESQLHGRAMPGSATHRWRSITTPCKPGAGLTHRTTNLGLQRAPWANLGKYPPWRGPGRRAQAYHLTISTISARQSWYPHGAPGGI